LKDQRLKENVIDTSKEALVYGKLAKNWIEVAKKAEKISPTTHDDWLRIFLTLGNHFQTKYKNNQQTLKWLKNIRDYEEIPISNYDLQSIIVNLVTSKQRPELNETYKQYIHNDDKIPHYDVNIIVNKNVVNQWQSDTLEDAIKSVEGYFDSNKDKIRKIAKIYLYKGIIDKKRNVELVKQILNEVRQKKFENEHSISSLSEIINAIESERISKISKLQEYIIGKKVKYNNQIGYVKEISNKQKSVLVEFVDKSKKRFFINKRSTNKTIKELSLHNVMK